MKKGEGGSQGDANMEGEKKGKLLMVNNNNTVKTRSVMLGCMQVNSIKFSCESTLQSNQTFCKSKYHTHLSFHILLLIAHFVLPKYSNTCV